MSDDPRTRFAETALALVDDDPDTTVVYAEIAGQWFGDDAVTRPDRVVNVGIREQLLVDAAAGMALAGAFPIAHTFAPFLVERAYEQVKLGFGHQDVDGLLVSTGGSVDMASMGRTHQTDADVALMSAVPGFAVHVPGTADEVEQLMRRAHRVRGRHYVRVTAQQNTRSFDVDTPDLHVARPGSGALVMVAVGPVLDATLAAAETIADTTDLDPTVLYTATVRPFDGAGLRRLSGPVPDIVLVEPYLAGTSGHEVAAAVRDRPHRLLALGFGREELRRYGTPEDHIRAAGLDADGITRAVADFVGQPSAAASRPA
ncbi:transketolase [uncultured Williamsia sp.]|uniref:transketolase n=1 Tax=uncultured Williamsia sp. TaxID=259311 RepID=UPI002627B223|nr:transketolase [uncultured Williamsia sp.]